VIGYCPTCKREWNTHGEAHCACCCSHFASDSAFDRHRAKGECVDPASLRTRKGEAVLELTTRASGPAWKRAGEPDHIFASALTGEESQTVRGVA
jgi:hypothetical protein